MYHPFTQNFTLPQKENKSVFVTAKNVEKIDCCFCQLLKSQKTSICDEKIQQRQIFQRVHQTQPQATVTKKIRKKSLRAPTKFTKYFENVENLGPFQQEKIDLKTYQISSEVRKLSRDPSKVLSKTTSSELGYALQQKPATNYLQIPNLSKHSSNSSSENIIHVSFQKNRFRNGQNSSNHHKFSQIPMVQSVSNNSIERMNGNKSGEIRKTVNREVFLFGNVKLVSSFSQSFNTLTILPVKEIIIPEASERSGLNSKKMTEREEILVQKSADWRAPPQLNKNVSSEYSDLIRTTPIKRSQQVMKYPIAQLLDTENDKPRIIINDKSKVKLLVSQRACLQISFDEKQSIENERPFMKNELKQNETQKQISPIDSSRLSSKKIKNFDTDQNKILQTSSKQQCESHPEETQELHEVLQSEIGSDKNNQQQIEVEIEESKEKKEIQSVKRPRVNHAPRGRYSVEIPKSKNFSGMKVRRTISMRDQGESQEEETSEVIYGFRQTHKQPIMEEINQDMQESFIGRPEMRQNNSTINNFRQLLS